MIDNPLENRPMEPSIYLSKEDDRMAGIGKGTWETNVKVSHKFEVFLIYKQL